MPLIDLPAGRSETWDWLSEVGARWFPSSSNKPIPLHDVRRAEARLGVTLPLAVLEWETRFAHQTEIWCLQDRLYAPDGLQLRDGRLIVGDENQGVVSWAILEVDLTLEDPPVHVRSVDDASVWLKESDSFSQFIQQQLLSNVKWSSTPPHSVSASLDVDVLPLLQAPLAPLSLPPLHWPIFPTVFFAGPGDDLLVEVHAADWVWITALGALEFRSLLDLLTSHGLEFEEVAPA